APRGQKLNGLKAKSAFLTHFPFACRGCTNRFRFSDCPPVPKESRPFPFNQLYNEELQNLFVTTIL
ncbi:hypothetical protein, partial [Fictibacillus barbaricus]|uniref:hypothetical protein n=1 Tax=Fictibacillus barbaricus TaxID=182136 RepID=UPI00286B9E10